MKTPDIDTLLKTTKEAPDHYAEHLAEVNKETDVVATEDIYNSKGVLVARRGARIDHSTAQRMVQHKLFKPLDHQVQINDSHEKEGLVEAMLALVQRYPDLAQTHTALKFDADCRALWEALALHPFILQKLTVLQRRLPQHYENALFCAWLSGLVTREMGVGVPTACSALIASLTHDIGFLHIPPAVLDKKGALTPEEWRAIQSHVIVGHMFLESVPGLNPRIAKAVLEHHERCDGTGYPLGHSDAELEPLGKVVGMVDSVQAIRFNRFQSAGRTLRDLVPYLQMNDTTHSPDVYRAMLAIVKRSGLQPAVVNTHGSVRAMAQYLHARAVILIKIRDLLTLFQSTLEERTREQKNPSAVCATLKAVVNNLLVKMNSAGLGWDDVLSWLASCSDADPSILHELNELELVQGELFWHVNNMQRTASAYFARECPEEKEICRALRATVNEVMVQADAAGKR